ncbi:MAG TPA: extracellular solute-binding protein [Mycobacterium sp.]|nr:extracellular solute-binding protein [Mycobacterium sp.]
MRSIRKCGALAIAATVALTAACSSSGGSKSNDQGGGGAVTLTWWHNGSSEPGLSTWKQVADAYHAAHPNVSFKINPMQNEAFKTKIPVALQGGDPPDIYQQWGSGAQATQVKSGKLMDLTQAVAPWIGQLGNAAKGWQTDGKQYGIPYDLHTVGFWYRTDLFQQAGITTPPATMDDLNADVAKLKAAGIVPISIGSKDKWPDAFWWEYLAIRECSTDTVVNAINNEKTDDPCFVKAGQDLKAFLDTKPFNTGFLGTPAQQGAGSSAGLVGNAKAAMELQGDWELPTIIPLTKDKQFASKLSWFAFPSVNGGQGSPGATLGGGDGFSCTKKAGPSCADFLKYIASAEVQTKLVNATVATLPANPAANATVKDPTLQLVLKASQSSPFVQTYFDQALPTAVGNALNDAIANFFAGQGSPEDVAAAVGKAAQN